MSTAREYLESRGRACSPHQTEIMIRCVEWGMRAATFMSDDVMKFGYCPSWLVQDYSKMAAQLAFIAFKDLREP